jgi:LacI family transcriptional regulator
VGDLGHDWYASGLIAGIDSVADAAGVSLELLGTDGDAKAASRRLQQSRPDVLAFAAPPLRHMLLIGEARRLDIPCIGTGTLIANIGVPSVCEDGRNGARVAVRHLADRGHRRIGFVSGPFSLPWVFDRRAGYFHGLTETGLEPDEGMVLWLDIADETASVTALQRYLDQRRPSALVIASWTLVRSLGQLVRAGRLSIPKDLSIVTFDQHPSLHAWLGVQATTMALPLHEMGRRLAMMAKELVAGNTLEPVTRLPCEVVSGESVSNCC